MKIGKGVLVRESVCVFAINKNICCLGNGAGGRRQTFIIAVYHHSDKVVNRSVFERKFVEDTALPSREAGHDWLVFFRSMASTLDARGLTTAQVLVKVDLSKNLLYSLIGVYSMTSWSCFAF